MPVSHRGGRCLRGRRGLGAGPRAGADPLPRLGEDVAENGDDLVELLLLGHERRRDLDDGVAAIVGAADEPALEEAGREEAAQQALALLVVERLARLLVLDELERVEEAGPAQVARDREIEELRERAAKRLLLLGHVLDDPLPLHDLDVLERDRRLDGMAAEGDPVRVHRLLLQERLHDRVPRDHGSDRGVRRREPLGAGDEVGTDVVALGREPGAEASEAGDDLVGAEQDPVAVAELAHALEVARRRREGAARVLHRLEDHHRHGLRPGLLDRPFEVLEQEGGELLLALLPRAVVAVRVADVDDVRDERLEGGAQRRDPVDRERAHRRPVVGDAAGDRLPAPLAPGGVVLAGQLSRRLDRPPAAGHEENPVQGAGGGRGPPGGELDRARMGVAPVRVEGELAHLRGRRLAHLLAEAVADLDREETGEGVEVALAVRILEVAALSAHDDGYLAVAIGRHAGEVQPEVIARGLLQLSGREARGGEAHTAPFLVRWLWKRMLASIKPTAATKMTIPITFTWGGAPMRAAPQTNMGNVTVVPALKLVMMKSSIERAKARNAAARMPGAMSGSVTRTNVVHGFAPRSMAASSRWRSKPTTRARTVTTTKLMLNMTCATKIVQKPRATPRLRNSVRSDAPRTISGVIVAMALASTAILRLTTIASWRPATANGFSQWSSVKPCHV